MGCGPSLHCRNSKLCINPQALPLRPVLTLEDTHPYFPRTRSNTALERLSLDHIDSQ